MDKEDLIQQIRQQLSNSAQIASSVTKDAAQEAAFGASPDEKRQDARVALEYSQMAKAQSQRGRRFNSELELLSKFSPQPNRGRRIQLGSIVEIENEESGQGRTLFLAPVGAGLSLLGPGGDGFLSVATPSSPLGKALFHKSIGDVVDVTVKGNLREWNITFVD